ncbi:hypothetical protein [Stappia sp. 28M-7]|uniref:hypothetical protein n=1 Tax=Stappia sp. 28M-7 TaxID=2762596 RepID=UPI00163CA19C|nr:hypothetical protein [Stappia sp. 28M-7]MBC2860685.1 hypothetical protein [Stappia sp. 28M-7]
MQPPISSGSVRLQQGPGGAPPAPLPSLRAGADPAAAVSSLDRLLAAVRMVLPLELLEAAHPASNLTPSGAPVEAAFVWADGEAGCDPRISLDPAPGAQPESRLEAALSLCRSVSGTEPAPDVLRLAARLSCWQQRAGCRYGAWAGLRQGEAGDLAAKLYLEVAPVADSRGRPLWAGFEEWLAGAPPVLTGRNLRPTMAGLTPDGGLLELYYRTDPLFPGDLDTLMRRFGLVPQGQEVRRLVERLTGRSVRFEIPSSDIGFSVAFRMAGEGRSRRAHACAFTFYSNAAALLGPDARIADALLAEGAARGWDMTAYRQAFAACDTRHSEDEVPLQRHGLIGMVLALEAPPRVTATLALPGYQREPGHG